MSNRRFGFSAAALPEARISDQLPVTQSGSAATENV